MTKIKKYTFDAEESVADMVNDCHPPPNVHNAKLCKQRRCQT